METVTITTAKFAILFKQACASIEMFYRPNKMIALDIMEIDRNKSKKRRK